MTENLKAETLAWRFKMPDGSGKDDFIVARTSKRLLSGLPNQSTFTPAYHWACAIDDHDGNYDLLVRSSDLKTSLQPQRAIQTWLGRKKHIPTFHTSLITQNDGHRLEKRTAGVTLSELEARGIDREQLISIFKNSFNQVPTKIFDDASFGEQNETLSLKELGL
jgi:glutamyl/glutaminyl-tRNA synthetase